MDFNNFKDFFKTHVIKYAPYKDSKFFQLFANFLMDSYFKDSYDNIPTSFKSAFENQIVDSDFVVPFLKSLGLPDAILDSISTIDQFKIINMVSDFHRYKGTVQLVDNLVTNFDVHDNMAVYELYLDRSVDNFGARSWDVLPKLLRKGKSFQPSLELTQPELFAILDQAPNWLVDKHSLDLAYDDGDMILPYKTNCLLLDSTIINNIEPIIQMVSDLVLATLRNEKIQIFFNNGIYVSTIGNVNMVWFYIFHKIYSIGTISLNLNGNGSFNPDAIYNRYVVPNSNGTLPRNGSIDLNSPLSSIQSVIDEYANISTSVGTSRRQLSNFYNTFINIFEAVGGSRNLTFSQYRSIVIGNVGNELISYIDSRLDSAINPKNESNLLMSEIYNSLLTFKSTSSAQMDMTYFDYYILNLPGMIKDIKNSTTYMLLNFLKPYHSDLIDRRSQKTVSNSKFNNALIDYTMVFKTAFNTVTESIISEHATHSATTPESDNAMSINAVIFNAIYNSFSDTSDIVASEYVPSGTQVTHLAETLEMMSEYSKFGILTPAVIDSIVSFGYARYSASTPHRSLNNSIMHSMNELLTTTFESFSNVSDFSALLLSSTATENIQLQNALRVLALNYLNPRSDTQEIASDNAIANSKLNGLSSSHISDILKALYSSVPVTENIQLQNALRVLALNYLNPRSDTQEIASDNAIANSKLNGLSSSHISDILKALYSSVPVTENIQLQNALRVLALNYLNPRSDTQEIASDIVIHRSKFENTTNIQNSQIFFSNPKQRVTDTTSITDVVTSFTYDNPNTGTHIVYTA